MKCLEDRGKSLQLPVAKNTKKKTWIHRLSFLKNLFTSKQEKRKPNTAQAGWNDAIKQTSHWLENGAFSSQNLCESADQPNQNMATKTFSPHLVSWQKRVLLGIEYKRVAEGGKGGGGGSWVYHWQMASEWWG